jgi:hypothetical protein
MALYVKFECATCENENCYGHSLHTTEKVCDGYKHTATNADRIRAKSDEELAKCLYRWDNSPLRASRERWLDWLKSPVEEGE